jgi:protein-S-isoprenylcysteine O-methyltransferase Ste14
VGALLKDPSVPGLILFLILAGFVYATGKVEEEENLDWFGDVYRAYIKRTKMLIPFLI